MNQRKTWIAVATLASVLALVGCDGSSLDSSALAMSGAGSGFVAGNSNVSGSSSVVPGGAGNIGGSASAGRGNDPIAPACTNQQHPDHMDKPCGIWKEWDAEKDPSDANCNAAWLTGAGYCLESCGKCTRSSGNGTGGGSNGGGTGLGPGPSLPDVTGGEVYWASRYWDCCKPHCAWHGMPSCGADGTSHDGGDSACGGGSAYACYDEAPRAVGDNVSYGYVAVPNPSCGTCFHLQFTGTGQHSASDAGSQAIAGKHMIVKVTNTGGDVAGNQFDLMIPGGGVGLNPDTCKKQWNASDLGATYGGFLTSCGGTTHEERKECVRQKCSLIPAGDARNGCLWFVDWFQAADNPNFRYEPIDCPSDM
jgi:hypothetical protein